jgi:hypothetical protein
VQICQKHLTAVIRRFLVSLVLHITNGPIFKIVMKNRKLWIEKSFVEVASFVPLIGLKATFVYEEGAVLDFFKIQSVYEGIHGQASKALHFLVQIEYHHSTTSVAGCGQ